MSKMISLAVLALAAAACASRASWTEYKKGPVTMSFPCKPTEVPNTYTVKCTTSDGSEWRLEGVDKGPDATPEKSLAEAKEYVDQIPNGEIIQVNAYPVKWRESRRTAKVEAWMVFNKGSETGWEYTALVSYSTPQQPAMSAEFFSKFKVE